MGGRPGWPSVLSILCHPSSLRSQAVHKVVVVEAALGVETEAAAEGSMSRVLQRIDHPAQAGVDQCHGTHGARLMHHVAVPASAEVGPASSCDFEVLTKY